MIRTIVCLGLVAALALLIGIGAVAENPLNANDVRKEGKLLAHNVYFTLADDTPENRDALVAACKKYLVKHKGVVFFAAGVLNPDLKREVNDTEFDVALHIVFRDKASHDLYQDAPAHLEFIDKNKNLWSKVRVFDSDVETAAVNP